MSRLRQVATVFVTIILTFGSTINAGYTTTVIDFTLSKPTADELNDPNIFRTTFCNPLIITCNPGNSQDFDAYIPPRILTNNSTFNATSFVYTIPQDVDAVWQEGISDIFNKITKSNDGKILTFSDGIVPVGDSVLSSRKTDGKDVNYSLKVDGTPVPEPTSTLGILAFGALGASSVWKRQQKKH